MKKEKVIHSVSSQLAEFFRLEPTPANADENGCSAAQKAYNSLRFRNHEKHCL